MVSGSDVRKGRKAVSGHVGIWSESVKFLRQNVVLHVGISVQKMHIFVPKKIFFCVQVVRHPRVFLTRAVLDGQLAVVPFLSLGFRPGFRICSGFCSLYGAAKVRLKPIKKTFF